MFGNSAPTTPAVFMIKPLLITCIVLSLGAAALGFLNRGKLTEVRSELEAATGQLALTNKQLEGTKGELESKKEEVTQLAGEKDKLSAELGEARAESDKAKEAAAAAQAEIEPLKQDNEAKDQRIAQLEERIAQLEEGQGPSPEAAPGAEEITMMQARLSELETVNQQLQDQNTALSTQIAELKRRDEGRQKMQMRQGLSGTILAVNQAWNFVVLSLGDRQGVVPNAEMLVQRDGQYLGKVRVTSVEPSTSIADILVRTVPRGLSVMPGDRVIYQAQRD
jgi:regulator of replication initiation timing